VVAADDASETEEGAVNPDGTYEEDRWGFPAVAAIRLPQPMRLMQSRPSPPVVLNTDWAALTRVCARCTTRKPLGEFHRSKKESFGRAYTCKTCRAEQVRSRR
jgi:hypothetical protein